VRQPGRVVDGARSGCHRRAAWDKLGDCRGNGCWVDGGDGLRGGRSGWLNWDGARWLDA
jgi:hypothetical protein